MGFGCRLRLKRPTPRAQRALRNLNHRFRIRYRFRKTTKSGASSPAPTPREVKAMDHFAPGPLGFFSPTVSRCSQGSDIFGRFSKDPNPRPIKSSANLASNQQTRRFYDLIPFTRYAHTILLKTGGGSGIRTQGSRDSAPIILDVTIPGSLGRMRK
jgi:hypothetical protein